MPWKERSVEEQRVRFVIAASRGQEPLAVLCREFGISRPTGYLWLRRYRQEGVASVIEGHSRRPHNSPWRSSDAVEQAVIALREQRPDWGARKLRHIFAQQHPELLCPSVATLHRILLRHQLVAPEDRQKPAPRRFERPSPNELWQMDFKGPEAGHFIGPLSVLDDHSRYLLCLRQLGTTARAGVQQCLEETFRQAGLPEAMLMDHGTPWWNPRGPWGWSQLTVWLMRQGIRILFSGIGHPQTQGKVERMHRALKTAARKRRASFETPGWLEEFRVEYNTVRPHEALSFAPPASRWQPSPRRFQPTPREWPYPAQTQVLRLGSVGELRWRQRRWEISYALKRELVGVELIQDGAIVSYCNTPLRHLHLPSGRSLALPTNPFPSLQR